MEKFRKKALIELVGITPEGFLVQNEGDSSDQWVIDPDTFETTYEKVEQQSVIYTDEIRVNLLLETLKLLTQVDDVGFRESVKYAIADELGLLAENK